MNWTLVATGGGRHFYHGDCTILALQPGIHSQFIQTCYVPFWPPFFILLSVLSITLPLVHLAIDCTRDVWKNTRKVCKSFTSGLWKITHPFQIFLMFSQHSVFTLVIKLIESVFYVESNVDYNVLIPCCWSSCGSKIDWLCIILREALYSFVTNWLWAPVRMCTLSTTECLVTRNQFAIYTHVNPRSWILSLNIYLCSYFLV